MKTKKNHLLVAGIGRRSLLLVVLLAVALMYSGASFAQSSTEAKPTDAKAAAPAQTATVAGEASAEKSRGRGSHEGLKVHGHWTIEVRNPDGKLVTHTEFENALCTTPSSNATGVYGDGIIANILSGSYVPGAWNIQLGSPTIPSPANPPLPCGTFGLLPSAQFVLAQSGTGEGEPCYVLGSTTGTLPCFATLSTPTVSSSYPIALTLSGGFAVPSGTSTTITSVGAFLSSCAPTYTISQCLNIMSGAIVVQITGTYLAPPQVATPVTVSGGQMVTVSVQLSFS